MQRTIKRQPHNAQAPAIIRDEAEVGGGGASYAAYSGDRVAGDGPAWKADKAHIARRDDELAMNGAAGDFDAPLRMARGVPLAKRHGDIPQYFDDVKRFAE